MHHEVEINLAKKLIPYYLRIPGIDHVICLPTPPGNLFCYQSLAFNIFVSVPY